MEKIIKSNTKKAKHFIEQYRKSSYCDLSDCYGKYSKQKETEFNRCLDNYILDDGVGFKITSYNKHCFTFAYRLVHHSKECIKFITKKHIYIVEVF